MYADYHLHSEFSDDSKELMERQVEKAIKLGLDEMCFTDHVDYGIKRDWDDPRGIEWRQGDGISSGDAAREPLANVDYPRYFAKIACIRAAYGDAIKIRSGLEFGIQSITVDDYERLFAKYQDELDFVPELPKQGSWLPEAEQLLQRLLAHVPALFRMLARRKTTRVIEMLAREAGSPVTRDLVIRGYITSSAKVTRYRLEAPLRAEGIDPEDYRAEFDYE